MPVRVVKEKELMECCRLLGMHLHYHTTKRYFYNDQEMSKHDINQLLDQKIEQNSNKINNLNMGIQNKENNLNDQLNIVADQNVSIKTLENEIKNTETNMRDQKREERNLKAGILLTDLDTKRVEQRNQIHKIQIQQQNVEIKKLNEVHKNLQQNLENVQRGINNYQKQIDNFKIQEKQLKMNNEKRIENIRRIKENAKVMLAQFEEDLAENGDPDILEDIWAEEARLQGIELEQMPEETIYDDNAENDDQL